MTRATVVDTSLSDSKAAGSALGVRILEAMPGERPDAVILFASPRYEFPPLLQALDAACHPRNLRSPSGEALRVTESKGMRLNSLNAVAAIFFDCAATRLRMGREFGFELDAVRAELGDAEFAGCNSIGQIARAEGQLSGFHSCTAVVCVIPE